MRKVSVLFSSILANILPLFAVSQDSSFVTIHYVGTLPAKHVYVDYSDGKNYFRKTFDSSSNISFKKTRYWRYADVVIYYPDTVFKSTYILNSFWVGAQPADIYILPDSNGNKYFQRYRLNNAFSVGDSGRNHLNLIEKPIFDSIGTYIDLAQKGNASRVYSAVEDLYSRLYYKELAYIRGIKESYFQLWLFRTKLAANHLLPVDTLFDIYHVLFSDSIRKGPEGQYIEALIERRLGPKIGKEAPNYALHSTTGQLITSENTRGKYVLFDFWASWCGPCVEEMPRIATIYSHYDSSKLLVISVTADNQEKDFRSAADRLHMTWPLIFGDKDVLRTYDVSALPVLFLIDPGGKIVYKSIDMTEKGALKYDDARLSNLTDILSKRLGQQ